MAATLIACGPSPIEKAIADFEQKTPSGSIGLDIKVLEWNPVDTITAADSAAILRAILEKRATAANTLFGDTHGMKFETGFSGTVMEPFYNRMRYYEAKRDTPVAVVISATWNGYWPAVGAKGTTTRKYIISSDSIIVFSAM